jgi:hypothetical protein
MWDMIGPYNMRDEPTKFGQQPASMDVLEAEAKDMWARKHSLLPLGDNFGLLCFIASQAVSSAILMGEGYIDTMSSEEQLKFRMNNVKLGTHVTESVVGHLLEAGFITYGENNELLGK